MELNKQLIGFLISGIFSIILVNLGAVVLSKEKYIGIITILIGLALIYFSYYIIQIKINEEKIKEFEEWKETREELLNTIKDIVILKRVSKIK